MHLLKSCKLSFYVFFAALFFFWSSPYIAYGTEFSAEVNQVEIVQQGDSYLLSAGIIYHLSDKAKSALQNGVPLFWNLHFKIQRQRDWLWDATLHDNVLRYRIQYNALLNMYRVRNENNGEFYSFSTLSSALELMSSVIDFPVIKKTEIDSEKQYLCLVKVDFDRDTLPLPLRPIAYLDPQWYLSSNWTLWPLKK
jgi:hypothetical protein